MPCSLDLRGLDGRMVIYFIATFVAIKAEFLVLFSFREGDAWPALSCHRGAHTGPAPQVPLCCVSSPQLLTEPCVGRWRVSPVVCVQSRFMKLLPSIL